MALQNPEQEKLLQNVGVRKRRGKFNNRFTRIDGIKFDSIAEAARYVQLINDPSVVMLIPCKNLRAKKVFKFACGVKYIPDFTYYQRDDPGSMIVEDVKGKITEVFSIKRKLMKEEFGIEVQQIWMNRKTAHALVSAYLSASTIK